MAFETKDSGVRAEYASGMVRDSQEGKPRFDLIVPKTVKMRESLLYSLWWHDVETQGRQDGLDTKAINALVDWYDDSSELRAFRVISLISEHAGADKFEDRLIVRWAQLMGRGADKYGDRNWEKSDGTDGARERAKVSAMRHGLQWWYGETDEDHAAAVCFNTGAVTYYDGLTSPTIPAAEPKTVEQMRWRLKKSNLDEDVL